MLTYDEDKDEHEQSQVPSAVVPFVVVYNLTGVVLVNWYVQCVKTAGSAPKSLVMPTWPSLPAVTSGGSWVASKKMSVCTSLRKFQASHSKTQNPLEGSCKRCSLHFAHAEALGSWLMLRIVHGIAYVCQT